MDSAAIRAAITSQGSNCVITAEDGADITRVLLA
jgi:hypothetical protein